MIGLRFLAAVILAGSLCCTLQAWQTYRHCRNDYGFARDFCVRLLVRP